MTKSMEQIHRIKELQYQEKGPYQIAKELKIDPKTVRKYMEQEDFSPKVPIPEIRTSKMDPYRATIETWLTEDEQNRHKQRHTSKRIHDRLCKGFPECRLCPPQLLCPPAFSRIAYRMECRVIGTL